MPHTFSLTTWRLLKTPPAAGAWNMAVDEAILEAVGRGEVPATLRLFAWQPPCLSLGYAQPIADVDQAHLQERGWLLVRRPTGGRAILHTDELTYSVIAPPHEPRLAGSVLESYQRLSQALLDALQRLGLAAQSQEQAGQPPTAAKGPVCFEVPSNYEITAAGRKLIGSAQARRKEGVLQHGTLPLTGDLSRITQALVFPDEPSRLSAAERLHSRATTLQEVLGSIITWEQAAEAFTAAFEQTLNLRLTASELTPAEQARAAALVAEKYAHPAWTERV